MGRLEDENGFTIKQINSGTHRFYEVEQGVYYPSVTTILQDGLPTHRELTKWFKQNGFMSDYLANKASEEGTIVHNAIEALLQGAPIEYADFIGREHLYEMVLKYAFFHTQYVVEVLDIETMGVSHELKTAGTRDQRALLTDGNIWVIDFKTSNYHHDKMGYQTIAYKQMCIEEGVQVDKRGVLHLKAKTRGADKRKKNPCMQGKGWKLIEHNDDEHDMTMFRTAQEMFWKINPDAKPVHKKLPTVIDLKNEYYEEDFQLTEEPKKDE